VFEFIRRNFRWIAGGFILTYFSSFGQTYFISASVSEWRAMFGLAHGEFGRLYMLATRAIALCIPFFGRLIGLVMLVSAPLWAKDLSLEEVVVTAQKREQNAQTVPVTVDTFSQSDVENTGALILEDMQDYIPGFKVGEDGHGGGITQSQLIVRGVEGSNISTGGDPSVAAFYDEVYLPRAATTVAFSDMQRIEVLKGPQGTLFGRNAAAGVVNMIPNAPGEEGEGMLTARIGNYGLQRYEGMGNISIFDGVAIRLNALTNQRDGVIDNLGPSQNDPREQDNQSARLAVRWDASNFLTLQLAYDYDQVDNGPKAVLGVLNDKTNFPDPRKRKLNTDVIDGREKRDMDAWTGKAMLYINERWSGKLITSYRQFKTFNLQDEDGTGAHEVYVDTNNLEDSDIFYNELQFNFAGDFLDLVYGLNYSKEETYQRTDLTFSTAAAASLASEQVGIPPTLINSLVGSAYEGTFGTESMINEGEFENFGVYGDADFAVNEQWNLIAGLRYSKDEKLFSWHAPHSDFVLAQALGENLIFNTENNEPEYAAKEWSKVTGRLVANYQISEKAMTYLSYSTGYKSGGFDSLNPSSGKVPLEPEEVVNIELGVKGDFFDSYLRTQVALFKMEIDGRQEAIESQEPGSGAAVPTVINTDEEFVGTEITVDWLVNDEFRMGLIYSYREQESRREAHFDSQAVFQAAQQVSTTSPQDYTVTLDWSPVLSFGSILFHIDYIFKDNIDTDDEDHQDRFYDVPGYGEDSQLLNARVLFVPGSGRFEFAVWAKNLLDDDAVSRPDGLTGDLLGTYHVGVQDPTTYGFDAKLIF
jgi:iron complex outermembrane receptor protein